MSTNRVLCFLRRNYDCSRCRAERRIDDLKTYLEAIEAASGIGGLDFFDDEHTIVEFWPPDVDDVAEQGNDAELTFRVLRRPTPTTVGSDIPSHVANELRVIAGELICAADRVEAFGEGVRS